MEFNGGYVENTPFVKNPDSFNEFIFINLIQIKNINRIIFEN